MSKEYTIKLRNKIIGKTIFEKADPPMGVVSGKIAFAENVSLYHVIKEYCLSHNIAINEDDPEVEAIFTQSISGLKVFSENDVEIQGEGATISGFQPEGYQIDIFGIPYPFYNAEFRHHVEAYEKK